MAIQTTTSTALMSSESGVVAGRDNVLSGGATVQLYRALCEEIANAGTKAGWGVSPSEIGVGSVAGSGNISKRFGVATTISVPVFIRVHFISPDATGANLTVSVYNATAAYTTTLFTWKSAGGSDVFLRIPPEEWLGWTLQSGEELTLAWTNPAAATWGIQVGMISGMRTAAGGDTAPTVTVT